MTETIEKAADKAVTETRAADPKAAAAPVVETKAPVADAKDAKPAADKLDPATAKAVDADDKLDPAKAADAVDEKPIAYDFKPAEGQAPYRDDVIAAYKKVAGERKLSQEDANAVLQAMHPAILQDFKTQIDGAIAKQEDDWRAEIVKRHGTVERAKNVFGLMRRGLDAFGNAALTDFLFGNEQKGVPASPLRLHPDLIDLLADYGRRTTNDRSVRNGYHEAPRAETGSAMDRLAQQWEREMSNQPQRAAGE